MLEGQAPRKAPSSLAGPAITIDHRKSYVYFAFNHISGLLHIVFSKWEVIVVNNTGHYVMRHSDTQLFVNCTANCPASLADQTLSNWELVVGEKDAWV